MKISIKYVVCMAVLSGITAGCYEKKQNVPPPAPQTLTVGAVKTQARDVDLAFEYTGKAQGSKETEVRARVGGILMKRNYVEGANVNAGQVLFQIDPEPYKIAMNKARAQLDQQLADLNAAEKQFARVKTLGEKGFSSNKAQDDAEARVLATRASIDVARAAYEDAKLNYGYTKVTAPISGITSMEIHSEGTLISTAGENSLLTTITQVDPIYVVFSVSDNELFKLVDMIKKGYVRNPKGTNDVKAKIELADGKIYDRDGNINFINPSVDQATGTLKLRAVFDNPRQQIIPGQFLRVSLEGLTRQKAIVLPKSAVMQGAKGSFVYIVGNDGKVASRSVVTGYTTKTGEWIIDEGLEEDETVVLDNFVKIKPGMSVNVQSAGPAAEQVAAQ